ncbi:MAG: hypothetical protein IGS49_29290 [Chlorogloeopsis fritschii C42_A2020_084]|uniref:HMA2 domain-containing protein n=1 Tax=Chlorogloeopsis fritschii TaxID=1124 RepID=UPI0019E3BE5E|nr:hypothetical protein [Chlorogloeopsis fritschii]MBF2009412.1 hypothetical protein [Chlorogloeopsis fritschii C42_A2020_084]
MVGSISQLQLATAREKKTQAVVMSDTNYVGKRSSKEVYSITYALPGQVGFCVPRITKEPKYSQKLVALLQAENLVTRVQVNNTAGSIAIAYKPGTMSDFEMRSHLIDLIHTASDALIADQKAQIQPAFPHSVANQTKIKQEQDKVAYSIAHAIPGQVGFCVPHISQEPEYSQRLLALLKAESLVTKVEVNNTAGSIVVTYQSGLMSDLEMRSHLINLIQSERNPLIAEPTPKQTASKTKSRQEQDKETSTKKTKEKIKTPPVSSSANHSVSSSRSQSVTPPVKTKEQAKQPAKLAYSIAHSILGRVRFHVPRIAQDPKYVQRLEALLKADPTVISERVNRCCASIVITYKSAFNLKTQNQKRSVMEAAISHLVSLLQDASISAIA